MSDQTIVSVVNMPSNNIATKTYVDSEISSVETSRVPYTGATGDVDLGNYDITAHHYKTTTNLIEIGKDNITYGFNDQTVAIGVGNEVVDGYSMAIGWDNIIDIGSTYNMLIGANLITDTPNTVQIGMSNSNKMVFGITGFDFKSVSSFELLSYKINGVNLLNREGDYRAITSTTTLALTDCIVECTTGTFTVNLPTAVGITSKKYIIKNTGTGVITVDPNSTETIDGATTQSLNQWDSLTIVSNGTNWIII